MDDSTYMPQVYQQLAAADGVSLDTSPHGSRPFSITCLAGDYRRLVQRPSRVAWRLLRYGVPDVDLAGVPPEGECPCPPHASRSLTACMFWRVGNHQQ